MQNILSIQENKLHKDIIKLCHLMELPLNYNHKGPKFFKRTLHNCCLA